MFGTNKPGTFLKQARNLAAANIRPTGALNEKAAHPKPIAGQPSPAQQLADLKKPAPFGRMK